MSVGSLSGTNQTQALSGISSLSGNGFKGHTVTLGGMSVVELSELGSLPSLTGKPLSERHVSVVNQKPA